MSSSRFSWLGHGVLLVFALIAVLPIAGVLLLAFEPGDPSSSALSLPTAVTFANFSRAWDIGSGFGGYLVSSAIVTCSSVVIATALAVPAGYAFGTMRFRGQRVLFPLLMFGLVVPLEAAVVPLYYDLRSLSLTGTYWALIVPHVALQMPFGIFWMRAFFRSVPRSLIDAAEMDGAGSVAILFRVLLPIARPAILTMVALTFVWVWNDFFLSLVMLSDTDALQTAPLALGLFSNPALGLSDLRGQAAAAVIVASAPVLVYLVLQRHFVRGVLSGSLVE